MITDYVTNVKTTKVVGRAAAEYLDETGGPQMSADLFGPSPVTDLDGTPLPSTNAAGAVWVAAGAVGVDKRGRFFVDPTRTTETGIARHTFLELGRKLGIAADAIEQSKRRHGPDSDPLWLHEWAALQGPEVAAARIVAALRSL